MLKTRIYGLAIALVAVAWVVMVGGVNAYDAFWACNGPCSIWQDVIRKSPRKPRAYINLGDQLAQRGDAAEAAVYYERALQLAQDRPPWEQREVQLIAGASLGSIYQQLGRYDEASAILVKTWNHNPGTPAVAQNLSYIALLYGNLALQDFKATRNPRGLAEMVRQAEQAIAVLDVAIEAVNAKQYRFENTQDLFWNRGEAYRLLGRCEEARENYATAVKLWPDVGTAPPCPIP